MLRASQLAFGGGQLTKVLSDGKGHVAKFHRDRALHHSLQQLSRLEQHRETIEREGCAVHGGGDLRQADHARCCAATQHRKTVDARLPDEPRRGARAHKRRVWQLKRCGRDDKNGEHL